MRSATSSILTEVGVELFEFEVELKEVLALDVPMESAHVLEKTWRSPGTLSSLLRAGCSCSNQWEGWCPWCGRWAGSVRFGEENTTCAWGACFDAGAWRGVPS